MVVIRLTRTGRKKVANYRIVVADSRKRRDGKFIELLGHYDPTTEPSTYKINHERALYWMKEGAQLSDTVKTLFHADGIVKKFQVAQKGVDPATMPVERKEEKKKKPTKSKKTIAKEKTRQEEAAKAKEEAAKEAEAPKEEAAAAEAPKETEAQES